MDELVVGKDDMLDINNLDTTDELKAYLRDDDLEAIKRTGVYLSIADSEICAHYGSRKCLEYMIENDMTVSPLLNLYAIANKQPIIVNVPHDDELYLMLYHNYESLEDINKPTVDTAIEALYLLSSDVFFSLDKASSMVRDLYTEEEWSQMNQRSVLKLIEMGKADLLRDCIITRSTYNRIKEMGLDASKAGKAYEHALMRHVLISRHTKPSWVYPTKRLERMYERVQIEMDKIKEKLVG